MRSITQNTTHINKTHNVHLCFHYAFTANTLIITHLQIEIIICPHIVLFKKAELLHLLTIVDTKYKPRDATQQQIKLLNACMLGTCLEPFFGRLKQL